MNLDDIQTRLSFALDASAAAERIVLKYFQNPNLRVDLKGDMSPVTVADRGAEEFLRGKIANQFPNDAVLGEEFGEISGTSGYRWVLDPIDGTKPFIYGVPLFGMLIGLQFEGQSAAGICRIPAMREVVYARRNGGAWWQRSDAAPVQVHVKQTAQLAESLFCFTDIDCWQKTNQLETLSKLSAICRLARGWGDCYGHMLVATGRAELMIDPMLSEWDAVALIPIIEEAGGLFMNFNGTSTATGGNGISTTPALKEEVLKLLEK